MDKFLVTFIQNTTDNSILLLMEQINQYSKLIINLGSLLDNENDKKLFNYYLEVLKLSQKEYLDIVKRLKEILELFFEYEEHYNMQKNFMYRKLYNEIKKV